MTVHERNHERGYSRSNCRRLNRVTQNYFSGDGRDFDSSATSFRTRQLVTVIADGSIDADGIKDGTVPENLVGQSREYAADALDDGVIDEEDNDDCHLQNYLS